MAHKKFIKTSNLLFTHHHTVYVYMLYASHIVSHVVCMYFFLSLSSSSSALLSFCVWLSVSASILAHCNPFVTKAVRFFPFLCVFSYWIHTLTPCVQMIYMYNICTKSISFIYAKNQEEKIVNVATIMSAAKVALGVEILFLNIFSIFLLWDLHQRCASLCSFCQIEKELKLPSTVSRVFRSYDFYILNHLSTTKIKQFSFILYLCHTHNKRIKSENQWITYSWNIHKQTNTHTQIYVCMRNRQDIPSAIHFTYNIYVQMVQN